MRRIVLPALVLALAAPASAAPAPSRLMVTSKEWSLLLSRMTVKPGSARIQLYNAGEDAHDLRLRRIGGTRTASVAETRPGRLTELRLKLRPGRYRLWCSLPGHAAKGMRATLRVRP